jgi:cyclophilin family peptidyl-prolyl cis-trans isomerase
MANNGKDTNGSQFFITCDDLPFLNGEYTIIGHVIKGFDTARMIANNCGDLTGKLKCNVKIKDTGIYNFNQYYSNLKV